MFSRIASGSRVSITCLRKPTLGTPVWEVHAALDRVGEADEPSVSSWIPDVDDLSVEDLLDLAADDVVDRLLVELAGNRLLDAVDQRQLGVPLPCLVHEARVVEGHAKAARRASSGDPGRPR